MTLDFISGSAVVPEAAFGIVAAALIVAAYFLRAKLSACLWLGVGALLFVGLAIGCVVGAVTVKHQWDVSTAASKGASTARQAAQTGVSASVDQAHAQAQAQIQTVYRDRVVVQTKEVPHEVIVHDDAACAIPNRLVSVWNSANRLQVPDSAGLTDERTSDVVLSDVAAQHDAETELTHENTEQLLSLQRWVAEQCAITGQTGCPSAAPADPASQAAPK